MARQATAKRKTSSASTSGKGPAKSKAKASSARTAAHTAKKATPARQRQSSPSAKTVKPKAVRPQDYPQPDAANRTGQKPMELYFWPTPNGIKISIMLEECGLPYRIVPVNIGRGDQFKPSFLRISPNNRMPALVDPEGPGGKPLPIFESGAILQYLGGKTGKFYPDNPRQRVKVDEWLFWQMANLGPMAGQAHHFRHYAKDKSRYARKRYTDEVNRLYGVLDGQLKGKQYIAGRYSIADMAVWPWIMPYKLQGQKLEDFPNVRKWYERMQNRPGVKRAMDYVQEFRKFTHDLSTDKQARKILFGQRARKTR